MKIHLKDEVLVNGVVVDTDEMDMDLLWGDYFPVGFARIEAVMPSQLRLIISSTDDVEVTLALGIKVPLFLLNDKKICGIYDEPFIAGQKFQAHFVYDRMFYVTRQTVTVLESK